MLDSNRPVDPGASGGGQDGEPAGHRPGDTFTGAGQPGGHVSVLERDAGQPTALTGEVGHDGFERLGGSRVLTGVPGLPRELEPTFFETLRDHQRRQAAGHPGATPAPQRTPPSHTPEPRPRPQPGGRPHAPLPGGHAEPLGGPFPERAGHRGAPSGTAQVAAAEDAKLLDALGRLASQVTRLDSLFPRLVFFLLGFTAITSLALAYIEALPLPSGAAFILGPAVLTMLLLGTWFPVWGKRALIGWAAGIVATVIYDVARLAAVELGVFGDPIPAIGSLLLNREDVPWTVGYAWRMLGNGGGMAIAFAMLPWRGVKAGTIYGTLICLGLFAVLYFFPVAQAHFFPLQPLTAVVAMLGHWIYGAVLGGITKRYLPPVTVPARRAAGGAWIPRAAAPAV